MRSSVVTAVALAGAATAQVECARGLHIVVARGSNEPKGTGATGVLAEAIAERIPGSNVVALDYPATITDPNYIESVQEGGEEMREVIREYIDECPGGKIAVMGYSQGAQVSGDAFCGDVSTSGFGNDPALPYDLVKDDVVAIVLFGDPSHVADASYNRGTANSDGLFPRVDQDECERLGDRLRSYCDEGDVYCELSGPRDEDVHGSYIRRYGEEVVDFVVERFSAAASSTGASTSASTPAPTPISGGTDDEGEATQSGDGDDAQETGGSDSDSDENAAATMLPGMALVALLGLALL
jgi:hypothetical protein